MKSNLKTTLRRILPAIVLLLFLTACGAAGTNASESAPAAADSAASTDASMQSASEDVATSETSAATSSPENMANSEAGPVRIAALKGPTSMGMAQFFTEAKAQPDAYDVQILGAPDQVAPLLVKGEVDIAAVPSNLASVFYAKTEGKVRVLNINTLGVLYLVTTNPDVNSLQDLAGKTVIASGKGATPEYALNYLLASNGLTNEVSVEWKGENPEVVAQLAENPEAVGLLPEPFVTTAEAKMPELRRVVDLTKEWDALQAGEEAPSALVMGVLVARAEFVEEHPEAVAAVMEAARNSVAFVNENPKEAGDAIGALEIVPAAAAAKAIPNANLVAIEGEEMKAKLSGYLQVLFDQNPASVGGAMPADDFYYVPAK